MEKQEKKTKVSGVYLVLAALTVLFAVSLVFLHKTAYEGASHGNYTVTTQDKTDEITAPTRVVTLVNVNTATAEELETLTGIGPSLAQAIIDYRAEHGDFTAIAENLFESEVFGHVRGAFTGAVRDKAGKFELADGGTLFLDEIGELSATAQSKLLRFLEDKVIERVGDNKPIRLDVRIIAATNRDLAAMMKSGTFREDLYYRLNVFECTVPPLRERPEDIEPLAAKLLRSASAKYGTPPTLSQAARQALLRYGWPGNVRELRNVMERVALLAAGREVTLADLPPALSAGEGVRSGPDEEPHILTLRELEAEHIRRVLGLGVSMERAAELLGINTVTLWRKRKELGA